MITVQQGAVFILQKNFVYYAAKLYLLCNKALSLFWSKAVFNLRQSCVYFAARLRIHPAARRPKNTPDLRFTQSLDKQKLGVYVLKAHPSTALTNYRFLLHIDPGDIVGRLVNC